MSYDVYVYKLTGMNKKENLAWLAQLIEEMSRAPKEESDAEARKSLVTLVSVQESSLQLDEALPYSQKSLVEKLRALKASRSYLAAIDSAIEVSDRKVADSRRELAD